ncbi:MAG: SapC family protein [Pseudomonadota bacterium]
MTQFRPIDTKSHRSHGWQPVRQFSFAAGDAAVPVALAELSDISAIHPLAFARTGDGGYRLVALTGLHKGKNVLIGPEGRWMAEYLPSVYRAYPFALRRARGNDDEERQALVFDHDSGLYRESPDPASGEQPFFEEDGSPTERLKGMIGFLQQVLASRARADLAVAALNAAGLLTDWTWEIDNPDPDTPLLNGLKAVDSEALQALDGDQLVHLRDAGALEVAYAQLLSRRRVRRLQAVDAHWRKRKDRTRQVPEDLGRLLGDDDTLSFD